MISKISLQLNMDPRTGVMLTSNQLTNYPAN